MKIKIYKSYFYLYLILVLSSSRIVAYADPILYNTEETTNNTDIQSSVNNELSDSDKEILEELQKANPEDFNLEKALEKVEVKITPANNEEHSLTEELTYTIKSFFKDITKLIVDSVKKSPFIVCFTLSMIVLLIIKKVKQEKSKNMK